MYEKFTDRARKIMQLANQEAQRLNHETIDDFHILLGIFRDGQGVAAQVLADLKISRGQVADFLAGRVPPGPEMVTMGKLPQTPEAKEVIETAIAEARRRSHNYVGDEHLLMGILGTGALAPAALESLGSLRAIGDEINRRVPDGAAAPEEKAMPSETPTHIPPQALLQQIRAPRWSMKLEGAGAYVTCQSFSITDGALPFSPGDRVRLKSGGPTMCVSDVGIATELVFCTWTTAEGVKDEAGFPAALLEKVP